jgi:hypothetical protein
MYSASQGDLYAGAANHYDGHRVRRSSPTWWLVHERLVSPAACGRTSATGYMCSLEDKRALIRLSSGERRCRSDSHQEFLWGRRGRVAGTLRVGILGAGWAGEAHIAAYSRLPGVEVAGLWSRTKARAEALAGKLGYADLTVL